MERSYVDVREYPEFALGHIPNAKLVPLGTVTDESFEWDKSQPITLVCGSGRRAEQAREKLAQQGFTALSVLPGGMTAWREAGKPIEVEERRPWSMERQVRTAAGSLVLVSLALGAFRSRPFLIGTAAIGAGLVFAGVSDTCMMASALGRMPWNRGNRNSG